MEINIYWKCLQKETPHIHPQCSAQPWLSRASYGPLSLQIQHGMFEIQETSQTRSRGRTWREENPRKIPGLLNLTAQSRTSPLGLAAQTSPGQ